MGYLESLMKKYQNKEFLVSNSGISVVVFCFCKILQLNSRVLISNRTDFLFLILAHKYQNQAFLVPNLDVFVF